MPTISQLPAASYLNQADLLPLQRAGQTVSLSAGILLAGTQPALTMAQGALLGRVSQGSGGPEPITIGSGLLLHNTALTLDQSVIATTVASSIAGQDLSLGLVTATGGRSARTLAARIAERLDLLDFGADPTGAIDCTAAFTAALAALPASGASRLFVPRGNYLLNTPVGQQGAQSVTVQLDDGATLTGSGYLGVARIEMGQGPFRLSQIGGGFGYYGVNIGNSENVPFDFQIIQNTPQNSGSARIGWSRNYANYNYYTKYAAGIDLAEQSLYTWPRLLDNTSGWGHWEVITGATYDEDTSSRAQLSASAEHSEFDIVNNGPDHGWTYLAGVGTSVQGMSMDPWGQNGPYGGHILFAYGTVGGYDGVSAGVNERWVSYPAVHSSGNPSTVARNSTITLSLDLTAKASSFVAANGGVGSVSVTSGGGAYTSVPSVVFAGGGGSGAQATAVVLGGAVVSVTVNNAGSGYAAPPTVSFAGGGVATPTTTTVTLNPDGSHGDLTSVAAAIRAAAMPMVSAAVTKWGGALSRLVIFASAPADLGTLTLGGTALANLGISAQSYVTSRNDTAVAFGSANGASVGDKFVVNGRTVIIGGTGQPADVAAAVNQLAMSGLVADVTANGRLIITAWLPQQPCGIVLSQPTGFSTLGKLGLPAGIVLPPTPPKQFATARGELSAPTCRTSDAISISASDLTGKTYGPVTVTLNGGSGTGGVTDVVTSIAAALQSAGWYSGGFAMLTAASSIVAVFAHNGGTPSAGIVIRNTAGGTLTLANAAGTPLDTLGLVAGTYQPGGYSPGSQTVFHAAPDSVAPQGRGLFLGGSSVPDPTVWPHTPAEFRGNFTHGLRTDRASFGDGNALLLGSGQAIGWGVGGPTLSGANGTLACTAPVSLPALLLTALPTSSAGLPSGSVWNNGGVLSIV